MRARAALAACVVAAGCATGDGTDAAAPPADVLRVVRTADGVHEVAVTLPAGGLPFNEPFTLDVRVTRTDGAPPGDVTLLPTGWMPDHGHGLVTHPRADDLGDGHVLTHGWLLHMRGTWELRFDVLPPGRRARPDALHRAALEVELR